MKRQGYAYFVKRPRRLDELSVPHMPEDEHPFEIVKTITLSGIDYTNLFTDMLADRQFIEDNCERCSFGESYRCLLVKTRGVDGGVLIVPENRCYVGWAAYLA